MASTVNLKRIASLALISLGAVGVIACVAAACAVWSVRGSVSQRTSKAFDTIDGLLVVVDDRVAKARERTEHARITLRDLEQALTTWSKREARERLAARLDIEKKAERVSTALADADHWLEVSASSLTLARQALEIGNAAGASLNLGPIDKLHEMVQSWRSELAKAAELAARVRDGVAGTDDEPSLRERFEQALRLALRVVATVSSLGDRLQGFEARVTDVRSRVEQLQTRTLRTILWVAVGSTAVLVWMAIGQGSLCALGWRGLRRNR